VGLGVPRERQPPATPVAANAVRGFRHRRRRSRWAKPGGAPLVGWILDPRDHNVARHQMLRAAVSRPCGLKRPDTPTCVRRPPWRAKKRPPSHVADFCFSSPSVRSLLNGERGSARPRISFCIRLGCRMVAIVGGGARWVPLRAVTHSAGSISPLALSTWCGAYSVGLDVVHPHLPAARVRVTLVHEAIRAAAGELGGT